LRKAKLLLWKLRRTVSQLELEKLGVRPSTVHYISAALLDAKLQSTQLQFDCHVKLLEPRKWAKTRQLSDTGASACFVSPNLVRQRKLKPYTVTKPIALALADGKIVGKLEQAIDLTVRHGTHISSVTCYITNIGSFDLILGMNWMEAHNPVLSFNPRSMTFDAQHCILNCLQGCLPETV
jgi:hypothetical protein